MTRCALKKRKTPTKRLKQGWVAKAWSVVWPVLLSYGVKLILDLMVASMTAPTIVEQLPRVVLV